MLVAADGDEALRICTTHTGLIHLVLMDVVMPGTRGRTVGEWVVRHRPGTRII